MGAWTAQLEEGADEIRKERLGKIGGQRCCPDCLIR